MTCIHCGVRLAPNGDGWQHENGLVSCRNKGTRAAFFIDTHEEITKAVGEGLDIYEAFS